MGPCWLPRHWRRILLPIWVHAAIYPLPPKPTKPLPLRRAIRKKHRTNTKERRGRGGGGEASEGSFWKKKRKQKAMGDAAISSASAMDASGSTSPAAGDGATSFSYLAILHNGPLVAAVLAFAIAQSIKFFTTWYKENRWDAKQLIGSGGMPSSHSATVTALAVAVGLQEGFASSLFATAAIFASVVMYDAFGVRLHAGKQAEVLNQIVYELPAEHPLADTRPLRELLGHTPPQVFAGGVLGFAVAAFAQMIAGLANNGGSS